MLVTQQTKPLPLTASTYLVGDVKKSRNRIEITDVLDMDVIPGETDFSALSNGRLRSDS